MQKEECLGTNSIINVTALSVWVIFFCPLYKYSRLSTKTLYLNICELEKSLKSFSCLLFFFFWIVAPQDCCCALIVAMLSLQGFEQKEGRKEGRFLRVTLRSLTGSACGFLVELSEMNVNEDGTSGERGKSK